MDSPTRIAILSDLDNAVRRRQPCPHPEYQHFYDILDKTRYYNFLIICARDDFWFDEALEVWVTNYRSVPFYEFADLCKLRCYRHLMAIWRHPKIKIRTFELLVWLQEVYNIDHVGMKICAIILIQNERLAPLTDSSLKLSDLPFIAAMYFLVTDRPIVVPGEPHIAAHLNAIKDQLRQDPAKPERWLAKFDRLNNHLSLHLVDYVTTVASNMALSLGFNGPR